MKFRQWFFLLIFSLMPAYAALSPEQQTIVQRVQMALNNLKTLRANIHQTNPDKTLVQGMICLKRNPGNLRLTYGGPCPIRIFANGEQLIYDEGGDISTYYTDTTPANFLIQDNIDLQRDLQVLDAKRTGPYLMVSVSRPGEASVMSITFVLTDAPEPTLTGWSVTDMQGQVTHVKLKDVELGMPLDPSLFQWTPG